MQVRWLKTANLDGKVASSFWLPRMRCSHDASMGRLYIDLHENHKDQPNVGKYTIHGLYGVVFCIKFIGKMVVPLGWRAPSCLTPCVGALSKGTIPKVSPFSLCLFASKDEVLFFVKNGVLATCLSPNKAGY